MSTKKETAILRRSLDSPTQDTYRRVYSPTSDSAVSINNIAQKSADVKGPFVHKKGVAIPAAAFVHDLHRGTPQQDTYRIGFAPNVRNTGTIIATSDSATPIDNIAQKNTDVKEPFQSLGGGDYGREFNPWGKRPFLRGEKCVRRTRCTRGKLYMIWCAPQACRCGGINPYTIPLNY